LRERNRVFAGGEIVGAPEVRDVARDDLDGVDGRLNGEEE